MRDEFVFWMPMDLRVSGKDLIFNHLTMSLYNFAAIWPSRPDFWPRGFFCNGHLLVDGEKMSKSTGNFLTIDDAVRTFTADATRIALADAGDSVDDANFQRETANAAIMKLYLHLKFAQDWQSGALALRTGDNKTLADSFFINELLGMSLQAKKAYQQLQYRVALKNVFFELQIRRDQYRHLCGDAKMHSDCVEAFIKAQSVLLHPIAPHVCEHIWLNVLGKQNLLLDEPFPTFDGAQFDLKLHRQFNVLLSSVEDFRKAVLKFSGKKKKKKQFGPKWWRCCRRSSNSWRYLRSARLLAMAAGYFKSPSSSAARRKQRTSFGLYAESCSKALRKEYR